MLPEILTRFGEEIREEITALKPAYKKTAVIIGPEKKKQKYPQVILQLFRFGYDNQHKNYPVAPPQDRSVFGFTFFIMAHGESYETDLEILEAIADHFDRKPFMQVNTGHAEYEVALSPMELSMEEINHFWIAQRRPHAPVLFYQARISEI